MDDKAYMELALAEARKAAELGEIPIGAVLVYNGEVIAKAHNLRETDQDATAHAEILVIRQACARLNRWRLSGCTLYVTVEPCPMCSGAIVNSRIDRVVYGCPDVKAGGAESIFNIITNPNLNHCAQVTSGVCEEECAEVMRSFFQRRRKERKAAKNLPKPVEVVAALIWRDGKFMICQRPANKARALLWEFVGGKVESGETKEQALLRECMEELNITIKVQDVFTDVTHSYPDLLVHLTLFNAEITSGEPQLLEHNDLRWISTGEIDQYEFCPADVEILEKIKRSYSDCK